MAAEHIAARCFRCQRSKEYSPNGRSFIYCPECREAIKGERIKEEVERMDWPEEIY